MKRWQALVRISGVVITYNEAGNIADCLKSMRGVVDEILVVDSYSTDETVDICKAEGSRVVRHPFGGYIEQKNHAMGLADHDCVLSLDGDEVLSETLRDAILTAKHRWTHDGYHVNRLTNYCGKWIRHCGWYPDKKLRLWDRTKGRWGGINPHDRVIMDAGTTTGHLRGDLLHYSYTSLSQHVSHLNRFSSIAAQAAYDQGKTTHLAKDLICAPVLTFLKKYLLQLGLLDGYNGWLIAAISGFGRFLKYAKLRELDRSRLQGRLSKPDNPARRHRG